MSKIYEIKTSKDGQQDIFTVAGDFIDADDTLVEIYRSDPDGDTMIAAFQAWVSVIEKTPEL